MIIGFVLDDTLDKLDGVQQAILTLGSELSAQGHEVHYIVAETTRTDIDNVHSIGSFINLRFNGNTVRTPKPASKKKIISLFYTVSFDVLHVQMPFSPLLAGRVVSLAPKSVKIIGTFHILPYNTITTVGTKLLGLSSKNMLKKFNRFYAVSLPALQFMEKSFGVSGTVLPNPIDYKYFQKFRVSTENLDKVSIVFLGRFDERKGVQQLVDAYSLLPEKIQKSSTLTMCGDGPLRNKLIKKSDNLKLGIKFPGRVSDQDKVAYLSQASIAIFPSISGESFGIVLAEAMASHAGITLGGNNPGYRSVLGAWKSTLFNGKNPQEIADIIVYFLENKSKIQKIGMKQHIAVKEYDVRSIVKSLLHDYS